MTIARRVSSFGKMATLWVGMVTAILFTVLTAFLFFAVALLIWLNHYVGLAAAAALAGVLLLLGAVAIFIGCNLIISRIRAKQKGSTAGDLLGMTALAIRMARLVIRGSPRKTLIAATIFGALADYFISKQERKKQ